MSKSFTLTLSDANASRLIEALLEDANYQEVDPEGVPNEITPADAAKEHLTVVLKRFVLRYERKKKRRQIVDDHIVITAE